MCDTPDPPANGRHLSITGIMYRDTVTFQCLDGYLPPDMATSVCNGSAVWTPLPSEYRCTRTTQGNRKQSDVPG